MEKVSVRKRGKGWLVECPCCRWLVPRRTFMAAAQTANIHVRTAHIGDHP